MELKDYKDIFGKPNTGIHKYKIFGIAVADVIMTIVAGFVIHFYIPRWHILYILLGLFVAGIILHRAFSVRTTVDKWLFTPCASKKHIFHSKPLRGRFE